jgi:predicted anti-sigma-YlaC factor YlaD
MRTKTARCPDVVKHICVELDARLKSAQCREIKKHLAKCPNCTAYLDSMKKTIRLYAAYPDPHLPAKARKQLFAVLKLQE